GLASDQHRGIGRRHLGYLRQNRAKPWRSADDLLEHRRAIDLFAQREVLAADAVFGSLEVVDVRSRGIPADDVAVMVPNRDVADQKPQILAILAARAQLGFERFTPFERPQACFADPRHIIRMETPNARIIGPYLFETESGEVQHDRIRAESTSIRTQDGDGVRNSVDCLLKLFVGGKVMSARHRLVELLTEVDVLALDLRVAMRVLQRDGGL